MVEIQIFLFRKNGVNHPVSLYAATKRSNELMAHTYSHLFKLPASAVRFLLFMDHGEDLIWHYSFLLKQF